MNFRERIINGLYGCAVADAVGNPFEFKKNINPSDVVNYANDAKKLVISDDTQMTMFGFEAIHNANVIDDFKPEMENSYIDWYYTQTLHIDESYSGLLSFPSMYSIQAPGNTCLDSLYKLDHGLPVVNDSMGCGSVMRLLPLVSLRDRFSYGDCLKFAKISGNITHKHKDNDKAIEWYMNAAEYIDADLAFDSQYVKSEKISDIGEGWIAPECVEMAIWVYLKADSFDDLLALSIAHDGDSDSVAAVAGSLWGFSGRKVPKKYIEKLDVLDAIKYVIDNYISKE